MKTFTKTVSMILIAVMCLSLFATGAYAMEFTLDDGGFNGGFSLDNSNSSGSNTSYANSSSYADSNSYSANDSSAFNLSSDNVLVAPQFLAEDAAQDKEQEKEPEKSDEPIQPILMRKGGGESLLKGGDTPDGMKFEASPSNIQKTMGDTEATVTISKTGGGTWGSDTFPGGYFYSIGDPTGQGSLYSLTNYKFDDSAEELTLYGSWLKSLAAGKTYYFFGQPLGKPIVPIGSVTVTSGDPSSLGSFKVSPSTYTQYAEDDTNPYKSSVSVVAADDEANKTFEQFTRFAVIPQGSSSGSFADGNLNIVKKSSGSYATFSRDFLDGLKAGYYDIYGVTAAGLQVKLGSVYIQGGSGGAGSQDWYLWPSYDIPWTSGDDPLMFRSDLMAKRQTYPAYTIVPRYGYGAGSIPNNMIDVNQFWDMGDGVFALGTNFLRSLPAGTYTLQVVDYKHLADCTNVVTFRIGSTLRPIDTDKHVIGSIKNLRFLCDEPVYEVYVGNIPLTYGEDYALSNGNKTITLSFEFLNKRSAGNTYTIKALTYSGTYPSSTFQILSTAQGSASPRTGDESNLGLWAAFLLLSGTAIVVLVPKLRKHDF